MGKYGTNREGFGAFEGGVNADKGAPLVSTSSDGETALLFGPAALREIQAGVANGDFAIPPDAAGDTITEENPLPYWTFTDVNSAGAITCAVVADATAGSGNILRWTIANGTTTSKSAQISRYIPIASSRDRALTIIPDVYVSEALGTNARFRLTYSYATQDLTTTGTGDTSTTSFAGSLTTTLRTNNTTPSDAAYVYLVITAETTGTTAALTGDIAEVKLRSFFSKFYITDTADSGTFTAAELMQSGGALQFFPDGGLGEIVLNAPLTTAIGKIQIDDTSANKDQITITSTTAGAGLTIGADTNIYRSAANTLKTDDSFVIDGANSEYVARVSHTATQSLTNNTSTKAVLSTASSTPSIETYDPNGWFNNANDSIDIGQDGFYCVTANAAFAANTTGRREVAIIVNGTNRGSINVSAASAGTTNLSVSTNLYLVSGDQVTITLVQTSGGALNTANVAGVFPALSVGRIGA
jgi:hypothetical protein